MSTSETPLEKVERLVKQYKALSAAARRKVNETDTQNRFIIPLFSALGWNFADATQVAAEEKISRGFVDYAFSLHGARRFVLETKSLKEGLEEKNYKQARDYAYHKGLTWAVLSDFAELKILNAELKEPNPYQAVFRSFGVDDYLPRFDVLSWLSPAELEKGTLDREAVTAGKRSTITPITQSLFDNLTKWRAQLNANFRAYNKGKLYTPQLIDDAVQRLLDRLIFIRTAEDREVEGEKLIALVRDLQARNRLNDLMPALNSRFRALDRVYNSELFAPHLSEDLDGGEPTTLVNVIEGLYGSSANFISYNFAFIDADVLGRVYEQYLGYVLSDAKAAPAQAKQTKRKSQGIYYTPTFVVKYIMQQTLGRYLAEHDYNPAHPVRVLDLACGSGSFLIEAFDVLDNFLARAKNQADGAYDVHDHARQLQILMQNIYGVDKDEQAVQVAQLNLLLKALRTPDKLPKLENIRQGDSLISGTPDELANHFGADWKDKTPFNWETQFADVMNDGGFDVIVGNPPYVRAENMPRDERDYYMDSGHFDVAYGRFDIHILFVERAIKMLKEGGRLGFIIPYAALNQNYAKHLRRFILDTCAIERVVDFSQYRVFEQAAVDTCILILRKDSRKELRIENEIHLIRSDDYSNGITEMNPIRMRQSLYEETVDNMFRLDLVRASVDIAHKVERQSINLGQICYVITGVVAHDSATGESKDRLIHDRKLGRGSKIYVEAKEVAGRYAPLFPTRYIEYLPAEMHRPKFPELFEKPKILIPDLVGERLSATIDFNGIYTNHSFNCCVRKSDLVGVQRNLHISEEDANLSAQYDLRFSLAMINSRLLTFYFNTNLGGGLHASPTNVRRLPIRAINFADAADRAQHDAIVALVTEMLALQKDYAAAEREKRDERHALKRRIAEVDNAIDARVYDLYDLSDDEIKTIAG